MRITCPNCQATYEVGDADIPQEGIEVECSACLKRWMQMPEGATDTVEPPLTEVPPASAPIEHAPEAEPEPVPAPQHEVAEPTIETAPLEPRPDTDSLRQALAAEEALPPADEHTGTEEIAREAVDVLAEASAPSLPHVEPELDAFAPLSEPSSAEISTPSSAEISAPSAPAGSWRVPTPPSAAFLESDPLDDILAEVSARDEHSGGAEPEAAIVPDELAEPVESAPTSDDSATATAPEAPLGHEETLEQETLEQETPEPGASSGPSFGGVDIFEPEVEPDLEVQPQEPEAATNVAPSTPEPIPAYTYEDLAAKVEDVSTAPEAAAPSPEAVIETVAQASGVAAIWNAFTANEQRKTTERPTLEEVAPSETVQADEADDGMAHIAKDELASQASEDILAESDTDEAALEAPAAEEHEAPAAEEHEAPAAEEYEAPLEVVEDARPAPKPHWSEAVAAAPVALQAEVANQGMEDFIRELKEEPSVEPAAEAEGERPAAVEIAEEPVQEPNEEEVFHPWEGEPAPKVISSVDPEMAAPEPEIDDDFDWEEPAAFNPEPDADDTNLTEHLSALSRQTDEGLLSQPPEISNVIQANIPQAPEATMASPALAPDATPRKPTPVDSTEDIEAAIRAQLTNFPKTRPADGAAPKAEKTGLLGKRVKAKVKDIPAAAQPAPPKPAPVDPLKAALVDHAPRTRSGKRTGFLVVMGAFVLALITYVFGDALSSMVPALAPFIDGLSGMVDGVRGAVAGLLGG